MKITDLSVRELSSALSKKELCSKEVTAEYLENIEKSDINAYITVCKSALSVAESIDKKRAEGEVLPPLAGIPFAVKDNICTKGIKTTCGSKMLENFIPPYNATVIEKLEFCPIIGKTNMDEFGMGGRCENSYFGVTKNPWDKTLVSGGSSGGSCGAVADFEAPFALGSDTGGSIRTPSAFCGCVGIKPTYGRVSRWGLVAFAPSMEQIGPVTRDVRDSALILQSLSGIDKKDLTSVSRDAELLKNIEKGVRGLRIAVPKELMGDDIEEDVRHAVLSAVKIYEGLGARVDMISIPEIKLSLQAYYIISSGEVSSNLARFDGVRFGHRSNSFSDIKSLYEKSRNEGFGDEVKRRIMLGTFALSGGYIEGYFKKAVELRNNLRSAFKDVFEKYHMVMSPTVPFFAPKIGERGSALEEYFGDICTVSANLTGLPAISLPFFKNGNGLPVGIQLMGKPWLEAELYSASYALEQEARQ